MGIIFSRFRKKKTTIEVLDDLDKKIKDIEQFVQNTEQWHKKLVGTLVIYSVILYMITALVFYFYFFPASLYDQLFYIIPLLIFPILILFTKRMVSWYYKRKISRNHEKFTYMQQEKKKILDEVTETETYKKAKEILLKFAPDQLRMTPLTPQSTVKPIPSVETTPLRSTPRTPQPLNITMTGGNELRRRALASTAPQNQVSGPIAGGVTNSPLRSPYQTSGKLSGSLTPAPRTPLPRPILPQNRSYIDKLVEYVVGDGPSNRYALICRQCDSHNGMALKEEFEYFAFRCCYCNFWNPARKQKPSAPKLEIDSPIPNLPRLIGSDDSLLQSKVPDSGNSTSPSDTDSDIEVVERPNNTPDEEKQFIEDKNLPDSSGLANVENVDKEDKQSEEMDVDESPKK